MQPIDLDAHWGDLRRHASEIAAREPALKPLLHETILDRSSFADGLTYRLARKLVNHAASVDVLHEVFMSAFLHEPVILQQIAYDMNAVCERDPACPDALTPLLYFKGFQALQVHRLAHWLWNDGRKDLAYYLLLLFR